MNEIKMIKKLLKWKHWHVAFYLGYRHSARVSDLSRGKSPGSGAVNILAKLLLWLGENNQPMLYQTLDFIRAVQTDRLAEDAIALAECPKCGLPTAVYSSFEAECRWCKNKFKPEEQK